MKKRKEPEKMPAKARARSAGKRASAARIRAKTDKDRDTTSNTASRNLNPDERERVLPGRQFPSPGVPVSDVPPDVEEASSDNEACAPGSIEQQLDMCEAGPIRGDQVGRTPIYDEVESDIDAGYRVDMSTNDREGDEETGDEHSSGYQGDEPELMNQPTVGTGLPGSEREDIEEVESDWKRKGAGEKNAS